MLKAFSAQMTRPEVVDLSVEERLGLLGEREMTERHERRLKTRLRQAKWRRSAALEDIDSRHPRGLDKALILSLASCQWGKDRRNLLITGPTGIGKTWLACALAQKACRQGYSALYLRLPRLRQDRPIAKGDGRYGKRMASLANTDVRILDDWGLAQLRDEHRRDLLEVLEDRHDRRSTLGTSQFPVDHGHAAIGNPTLADAILDRLVHNAYKITLTGESMRKQRAAWTKETAST